MKRIYLAGKMTGQPLWGFPAFDEARDRLLAIGGWEVVSPADMDREHGFDPTAFAECPSQFEAPSKGFIEEAIKRDIAAILTCEAIYMLKGWQESVGATAEYHIAKWRKMEVIYEEQEKKPVHWDDEPIVDAYISSPQPPVSSNAEKVKLAPPTDPKGAIGATKTPFHFIPWHPLEKLAWVMKLGAEKYGKANFRKNKVCSSTYESAIMRHLQAYANKEEADKESGQSHLAHVAACAFILIDAKNAGMVIDDRE